MENQFIKGIHHITAITGNIKNNIRFYTGILGLRFVKKTINYDSPDTWHFYYGDQTGTPGTIITFFPFMGISKGRSGNKSVNPVLYSIGEESLAFWMERLKRQGIDFQGPFKRFEEEILQILDWDGMNIELVANSQDKRIGWEKEGIPAKHAIKGFFGAVLNYANAENTSGLLVNHMNHKLLAEENNRIRLYSDKAQPGNFLDLLSNVSHHDQIAGSGTVHHIAFVSQDENSQLTLKSQLENTGIHSSPVMDRQYFRSVYFREPGGILFEIATQGPGFLVDEKQEMLGTSLSLPSWLEARRSEIESGLIPIS